METATVKTLFDSREFWYLRGRGLNPAARETLEIDAQRLEVVTFDGVPADLAEVVNHGRLLAVYA